MSANSKIEWTDHTFNPWRGCTKVSPGCANCYAETLSKRNPKLLGEWGQGKPRILASDDMWKQPLKWNEEGVRALREWQETAAHLQYGEPPPRRARVFTASLADWLDDEVSIEWLARLLELIHSTPQLDWLLLTKRPENWKQRMIDAVVKLKTSYWVYEWIGGKAPANVWMGTTVEDQAEADKRIPVLLSIPARVRFLSCEPLLGAVDLTGVEFGNHTRQSCLTPTYMGRLGFAAKVDWVICGGESGHGDKIRPMHPEWARSLRDQCATAGVPFFFKQWGEWLPCAPLVRDKRHIFKDGQVMKRFGKKAAGRLLDGVEHSNFPA